MTYVHDGRMIPGYINAPYGKMQCFLMVQHVVDIVTTGI
jgi:hypothetical protein